MYRSILAFSLTAMLLGCGGEDSSTDTYSAATSTPLTLDCPSNMECGLLAVPKNYANDNGEKVNIYYGIHRALDSDNRIGILVLNFGGPGGEAVKGTANMVAYHLPADILEHFDIVGLDPRGAGKSAFAKELTDCAVAQNRGYGNCDKTYAEVAPYLGSNTIVKDIDQLRSFLGEDKLNFLGYSYGTRLGSLYANTFPENVRAIVLDSPMPPVTGNYIDLQLGNTAGYDLITDYRLEFNRSRKSQYEYIANTLTYSNSYLGSDGSILSRNNALSALYLTVSREKTGYWQAIKSGIFELLDNDSAARLKTQINSIIKPATTNDDLRFDALFKAVVCTDESQPLSAVEISATQASFTNASALFGLPQFLNSYLCADWKVQRDPIANVENMEQVLTGQQILIIAGKYDPATPYQWANAMADSFANLATLISVDQLVSHGFSYTDLACVDNKTTQYLLDPTIKIADTECSGTPQTRGSFLTTPYKRENEIIHPARRAPQGSY